MRILTLIANSSLLVLALGCHSVVTPPAAALTPRPVLDRRPDPRLYRILTRVEAKRPKVLVVSHETGRVRGDALYVRGDSVFVVGDGSQRTVPVAHIDSLWVRGNAATVVGGIAAAPCALFFGLLGTYIATDPDSGGDASGVRGFLTGAAVGGSICGIPGVFVGALIPRWRLQYARR